MSSTKENGIKLWLVDGKLKTTDDIISEKDVIAMSDFRNKYKITRLTNCLEKLDKINGYTFFLKNDESVKERCGLIAQEVNDVLPQAVHQDNNGYMNLAYGNVLSLLIESVKELKSEIRERDAKHLVLREALALAEYATKQYREKVLSLPETVPRRLHAQYEMSPEACVCLSWKDKTYVIKEANRILEYTELPMWCLTPDVMINQFEECSMAHPETGAPIYYVTCLHIKPLPKDVGH